MAKLHIVEFTRLSNDGLGNDVQTAEMPGIVDQVVTFTSSAQSVAFNKDTRFVRLIADAKAHILFGSSPTATADNSYIAAGVGEYFGVKRGDKVAAYDGTT